MRVDRRRVGLAVNAARDRHERLRVTPHAVLADVEPLDLVAGADAQADGLVDDPEQAVAEREHGDERRGDGRRLRAQLVQAPGVEEAALPDAVELGQRRDREEAAAESAPDARYTVGRQRTAGGVAVDVL